ncbi:hypothetical protein GQ53DRAFT_761233 [Thozetella sp. PMI_491]|nr:hypothetical protein GQ53DRAFT_761233 [Thozetella sp. PMI_491]
MATYVITKATRGLGKSDELISHPEGNDEEGTEEVQAGEKRKISGHQPGRNKKKSAEGPAASTRSKDGQEDEEKDEDNEHGEHEDEEKEDEVEGGDDREEREGSSLKQDMDGKDENDEEEAGGGHPEGKVLEAKEEKTTIMTKKGNQVSRKGKPADPTVVVDAGSSKATKLGNELD